mmetsp:Transcript_1920/g.5834  ORF Transcript_1920/g.5834 Transcript_1920/m.5834 type:complete len:356 (+) Transcript_1920:1211-2278(+)
MLHPHLALLGRRDLHLDKLQGLLRFEGNRCQALDVLARGLGHPVPVGRAVDRRRRHYARVGAPPQHTCELGSMKAQVVLDEGGDEVVRVVVALLHPERQRDAPLVAGRLQSPWLQLILEEIVASSLVHEQPHGWSAVLLHQLDGVVLLPALLVGPQVEGQGLLSPRAVRRVRDGGEGGDGPVGAWILQRDGQGAVSTHAVAHDPNSVRSNWQMRTNQGRQLLCDVVQHVIMLPVLVCSRIQVKTGPRSEVVRLGLLVRHALAPRGRVGHHQHEPELRRGLEGAGLLGEVLVCTGEPAQPEDRRKLGALLNIRGVGGKLHRAAAERRALMLKTPEAAPDAPLRGDLLQRSHRHARL